MLQRAASNAYSWWWASHIKTNQSKWLHQNLQDMEEKVKDVLILLEEDGDTFAKRAEMYYKKRPEIINFVEQSYRAYRAMAERYEHISTELQKANSAIGSVFPGEVELAMDEEDDASGSKTLKKASKTIIPRAPNLEASLKPKRLEGKEDPSTGFKSGLMKTEALREMDSLQKQILMLQTEKEFASVSYESSVAKFWEIEKTIAETHGRICILQEEFGAGAVIEDHEARTLMASTALDSCKQMLTRLQEKREKSAMEAEVEHQKVNDVRKKIDSAKERLLCNNKIGEEADEANESADMDENYEYSNGSERENRDEMQIAGGNEAFTATEMAEKVDELVTKLVTLESAVSHQTALIRRLGAENDELQAQIRRLEKVEADDFSKQVREMEENLQGAENLNQDIKDQNKNLESHFTEAYCNVDHLTEKLESMTRHKDISFEDSILEESVAGKEEHILKGDPEDFEPKPSKECEGYMDVGLETESMEEKKEHDMNVPTEAVEEHDKILVDDDPSNVRTPNNGETEKDDEPNWREWFLNGLEGREKILLEEYTSVLRNFKESKKRIIELEKNNQENLYDATVQIKVLQSANVMKDLEIQSLHLKLKNLQAVITETIDSNYQAISNLDNQNAELKLKYGEVGRSMVPEPANITATEEEDGDDIKVITVEQTYVSPAEEKFRSKIDELLEQNLDFWLRFSTSFQQIQTYQAAIQNIQDEIFKLKSELGEKNEEDASLKSDARPVYKNLRLIQTELTVWVEHSVVLKAELQSIFLSLCKVQEELSKALKEGLEEGDKLNEYQAAKFQGEVMNMKQENNKVADELQEGLDHVAGLQIEVERMVVKLNEEFKLFGSKHQTNHFPLKHTRSRSRVPLRSFIFGTSTRTQKPSVITFVQPVLNRKYQQLRAGLPM